MTLSHRDTAVVQATILPTLAFMSQQKCLKNQRVSLDNTVLSKTSLVTRLEIVA